jgi:hypothetical protein
MSAMPAPLAARLFAALGASPAFVDDVLGDLEELRAQPRPAGMFSSRFWYAAEVLCALPHALRDGLRGVGLGHVIDWGQKALSAHLLLGVATLVGGGLAHEVVVADILVEPNAPLGLVVAAVLAALLAWCVALGYLAAWMERERPLIVTLATALFNAMLHTLMLWPTASDVGAGVIVFPTTGALLIAGGGLWRTLRRPASRRLA